MNNELVVYLCGRRTGMLIRKDNGNMQFRYDHGYTGPAVSHAMPLQDSAHPHSACVAVFGGLLAEGESREALARNLGISRQNDFALIEELGGDCAGAISVLPTDVALPSGPQAKELDAEELDRIIGELPQRPLAAHPAEGIRLSLAGAQPKLPVILDGLSMSLPMNAAAATTHIIKPEPERFPGLVDNEAFCMELAHAIDLPVARTSKHISRSGRPYLLATRFDRDITVDPIRRLHQEDICQALGRASESKYQSEGGPSVAETVELLRDASSVPARDLPTFWRALVFNWLIGNCDAHAKNFSLLYDGRAPTLAPLYDLVSTAAYPVLTKRLAMSIDGARELEEVATVSWEELAAQVGYSARFAREATNTVVKRMFAQSTLLTTSPIHSNDTARSIAEGIRGRALRAGLPL
ncbi:MAG: HipA domain-containing protein [Solirubrobacteraceae bacterium]